MTILRDYLTVHGLTLAGAPVTFGFWTGEDDVAVNVVSATDGSVVSRNFVGGGSLPEAGVPSIVDAIGLEARAVDVSLNQLHGEVQDMVRGNNVRVAVVELHRGYLDQDTWALEDDPEPIFLGRMDGAVIETPAVGGEGATKLTAISDVIDLTRTGTSLKSDETQKLRSADRFRRYADTAGNVEVWWGLEKGTA